MLVNADITLYNRRYDATAGKEIWHKTHIRGVSWKGIRQGRSGSGTLEEEATFSIRIPVTANTGEKEYVTPKAWQSGDAVTCWTLQNGDVIFLGIITEPDAPDETDDMSSLLDIHGETVTIMQVADNQDSRSSSYMKHWRAVGK